MIASDQCDVVTALEIEGAVRTARKIVCLRPRVVELYRSRRWSSRATGMVGEDVM